MNTKPAKIVALAVFLTAAVLAVYFSIGSFQQDSDNSAAVRHATDTGSMREAEFISLSSIKYGIEETALRSLLKEYDGGSETRQDYRGEVIRLSEKYGIRRENIAEILLNRKVWKIIEEPPGLSLMTDEDRD